MNQELPKLHAVIGVWIRGKSAFYVKRSETIGNYPGVWSLFSIQYSREELPDPADLNRAQPLMERMASERLYGAPVRVKEYFRSRDTNAHRINKHVFLDLYEVSFDQEPKLNPDYYSDGAWLTFDEFEVRSKDMKCGSCTPMWWDEAHLRGLVDRPYIPDEEVK